MAPHKGTGKPAKKQNAKTAKPAIEVTSNPEPTAPKRGRPTAYTRELGDLICARLAQGKTLTSVCKSDDTLPAVPTILGWALDTEHPFFDHYARARLVGYHVMADQLVDQADDGTSDTTTTEDGAVIVNHDVIARSRLRVDTRKWLLSKALPKIYGDKLALTDPDGGKLTVQVVRLSDANG